jgi:hypothetical protein
MKQQAIAVLAVITMATAANCADAPVKHIRLIVDTSQSLHGNDPNGYVKTATALFYELMWQVKNANDTFTMVQFNPKWDGSPEPPESVGDRTTPGWGKSERRKFVEDMLHVGYTSPFTYFSPCLKWAYNDLKDRDSRDQKIIVMITDGKPDPPTIKLDAEKIAALVPQLRGSGVKVYILAFGPEVNKEWFDNAFGFGRAGGTSGEAFVGSDASHLLDNMLDIFARSFGYFRQNSTGQPKIDVTSGVTRDQAIVVALYRPGDEPGFQLTAPNGTAVGEEGRFEVSGEPDPEAIDRETRKRIKGRPVSYAYQCLHKPAKGEYGFKSTKATPLEVAVLWPNALNIEIRAYKDNPIDAVMAGKPAPMEVLVSPASGAGGDPGPIRVLFHLHYLSQNDDSQPYAEPSDHPAANDGELRKEGKAFLIQPEFIKNLSARHDDPYAGYIDVIVKPIGSETEVARITAMQMVSVYPFVSIRPTPPEITLRYGAREELRAGEDGCKGFNFQLQGDSNSLRAGSYSLGVRLDPAIPSTGGWRGARVRFDNRELDLASKSPWQTVFDRIDTQNITRQPHTLCVHVGTPTGAEDKNRLTVRFGIWPERDERYARLNAVEPLAALVSIEAPNFWQIWKPWLLFLVTLLLMYLTYLYWKLRQLLPPDMAVSLADTAGKLTPARLGDASFASRWLGLPQDRPVISLSGDKALGSVRPLTGELFVFVPAKGFGSVMVEEDGVWHPREPRGDGAWLLEAGKRYRVGTSTDSRYFRLDYSETRPAV